MTHKNYHTHTIFCDGKDTPESLVEEALRLGCQEIGFSGHSYTYFDESWCMSKEKTKAYRECILRLKSKYKKKIKILLGIEQDLWSEESIKGYDFVIGGVHYVKHGEDFLPTDESAEMMKKIVEEYYSGDYLSFCEAYYSDVAKLSRRTDCDIIAHFDLITKNNEIEPIIDVNDKRYKEYAIEAVRSLCKSVGVFEINTGAISRGYRKTPYLAPFILKEIKRLGGEITISSDCHDNRFLTYYFDECALLAKECGFDHAVVLTKEGFKPVKL